MSLTKEQILENIIMIEERYTVEEYLNQNAVSDQCQTMDGPWVPLNVAWTACKLQQKGDLTIKDKPSWIKGEHKIRYNPRKTEK